MGHSVWSGVTTSNYMLREHSRIHHAHTAYTTDVIEGRAESRVHDAMNPYGITRESRDSDAHPTSLAIGVMFDVTGSMGRIPRELQRRLANLMTLLTQRQYVDHPAVLFGAIGDATCDRASLQIGQFESGLEMDQDLERVYAESGGGGHITESYQLAHYFFARHTITDCFARRANKGYLFTMGDEMPYTTVSRREVQTLMGDSNQTDLLTTTIVAECQRKWHVFHLVVETSTSEAHPEIKSTWETLLGADHVVHLRDPKNVAEIIGLIIGMNEGRVTNPEADLAQLGVDAASIQAVVASLRPLALARGIRLTEA